MVKVDEGALGHTAEAILAAATRGEEVIIEREGQPDLRVILQSEYLALTAGARAAPEATAPAEAALAEAAVAPPAEPAGRAVVSKLLPSRNAGPALDDQLAAEELVASIDAHKVGWEP
ncbi:MAG: hypothetical protein ACRDHF_19570, partial [Tepidiformaceae bacterium]